MNIQIQSEEYKKYMSSSKWQQVKSERIKIDNNACAMCGYSAKPQVLMVHHMNYARLGHEDVWHDLVTLCPICHRKLHRMLKRRQEPES